MSADAKTRLNLDKYYMGIAVAVRIRGNCRRRKVGAVAVKGNRIVSTGYNGTPEGAANCTEGGCYRCANPKKYPQGEGYDICICVHAEQNALLAAARFGNALDGASVYTTLHPCFNCMKEMIQVGIRRVFFQDGEPPEKDGLKGDYEKLASRFDTLKRVEPEAFPAGSENPETDGREPAVVTDLGNESR
jgi:dCMP deaminase